MWLAQRKPPAIPENTDGQNASSLELDNKRSSPSSSSSSPWRPSAWIAESENTGGIKFDRSLVVLLILVELIVSILIIYFIPYTHVNWKTYMQEVEYFQNGERNYYKMQGNMGPLVYPAGFVYIFAMLRSLSGENHLIGQIIFMVIYLIQVALVLLIVQPTSNKDTLLLCLVIASKRIHSVYLLHCFNDGIAMTFTFASIFAAQRRRWITCCILFSVGVSVKMNVFLYAPGLLWLLWDQASGHKVLQMCGYLSICVFVQLFLGLPFLLHHPIAYLHRAFEFGRVLQYESTVNWKFLPEWVFTSTSWVILLVMCHIIALLALWKRVWIRNRNLTLTKEVYQTYITFVFYSSNFVGIIFARSLHYQFYSWYFPTVPFLLCHSRRCRMIKFLLLLSLECCWNVDPQRADVSFLLFMIHSLLLIGVFTSSLKDLWRREFVPTKQS